MANVLFTSKKVLNIEFSQSSSWYLLKLKLSIAYLISEASTCKAANFFMNSANFIMRTNTTVLKSLQLYKDTCRKMSLGLLSVFYDLSAHFVKKKLKSNIIYNSAPRVIRTHVLTSASSVKELENGEKLLISVASWWPMRSRPLEAPKRLFAVKSSDS